MLKLRSIFATVLILCGALLGVIIVAYFVSTWLAGAAKIVAAPPTVELAIAHTPTATLTPTLEPATATITETFSAPRLNPSPTSTSARRATATASVTPSPSPSPTPTTTPAPVGALSAPQRIVIKKINADVQIVSMRWTAFVRDGRWQSQWDVPKNDVGHIFDTANPGERGNVVLAGHNNLYAAVFKKLYTLNPGDEIEIHNRQKKRFLYRVVESYIVAEEGQPIAKRLENARVMEPTQDARLTIISCWPEWSNVYRAIIIAKLIGTLN